MDVCGTEAQFAGARTKDDMLGVVELLELLGDLEGSVGGGVVDDDDFVVEVVLCKGAVEEPDYYGQIAAFVVLGG